MIKTWQQRCEEHPDHEGIVTEQMIRDRMQEEIDELRQGEHIKCIVKDCQNHIGQGRFVGNLCSPCHEFLSTGNGVYSQAYRNTKREWVGLTDEERRQIVLDDPFDWVAAVEAKLKEKNT